MQKNTLPSQIRIYQALLFAVLVSFSHVIVAQKADSTKRINTLKISATVANNGISLLPTFSLGKPAAIFDLVLGRKLTFEPQLRFALNGQPWTFLFWWRYKLINTNKFRINLGAHPAFAFKTSMMSINGVPTETTVSRRYLAGEFSPNYMITKNISVGLYYLYSHGVDVGTTGNTHFITINTNFSDIKLSKQFFARFNPQFYYLRMDDKGGYYVTSSLTLANRKFPISISATINKVIKTDIGAGKDLVWNVSLIYAFRNEYVSR